MASEDRCPECGADLNLGTLRCERGTLVHPGNIIGERGRRCWQRQSDQWEMAADAYRAAWEDSANRLRGALAVIRSMTAQRDRDRECMVFLLDHEEAARLDRDWNEALFMQAQADLAAARAECERLKCAYEKEPSGWRVRTPEGHEFDEIIVPDGDEAQAWADNFNASCEVGDETEYIAEPLYAKATLASRGGEGK